jgi:hypothetical protein
MAETCDADRILSAIVWPDRFTAVLLRTISTVGRMPMNDNNKYDHNEIPHLLEQ